MAEIIGSDKWMKIKCSKNNRQYLVINIWREHILIMNIKTSRNFWELNNIILFSVKFEKIEKNRVFRLFLPVDGHLDEHSQYDVLSDLISTWKPVKMFFFSAKGYWVFEIFVLIGQLMVQIRPTRSLHELYCLLHLVRTVPDTSNPTITKPRIFRVCGPALYLPTCLPLDAS